MMQGLMNWLISYTKTYNERESHIFYTKNKNILALIELYKKFIKRIICVRNTNQWNDEELYVLDQFGT
jgi:uncharacterized protein YbaP (TraB family)